MQKVAIFGGSFNPPTVQHRAIVEALRAKFDVVVIVPCGPREEKRTNDGTEMVHRAALVDIAFGGLPNVIVDLSDLEREEFTPSIELLGRYMRHGDVWLAVGTDLIQGASVGNAEVQHWVRSDELWHNAPFVILERPEYPVLPSDLPPRHLRINGFTAGSSTAVRERLFRFQPVDGLVTPTVAAYIERYGLFHGAPPRTLPSLTLNTLQPIVVADERNERAASFAATCPLLDVATPPNCILVIGGDGTMLHAIRTHWRQRLPFVGVNFGTFGYLLNDLARGTAQELLGQRFELYHAPLLYAEATHDDGRVTSNLAFNDAYVVAAPGKAVWVELRVDDAVMFEKVVADGMLVSTAAGSTSYARAMGATPMPTGTRNLLVVGSNVFLPIGWKAAQLDLHARVTIRSGDPTPPPRKRPMYGFVDGVELGEVTRLTARLSNIAAVELAFLPGQEPRRKIHRFQFPS